jgi:hypothetical protein
MLCPESVLRAYLTGLLTSWRLLIPDNLPARSAEMAFRGTLPSAQVVPSGVSIGLEIITNLFDWGL